MICPILRCHQRSGSSKRPRTVRTVRTASATLSIAGKENAACQNARFRTAADAASFTEGRLAGDSTSSVAVSCDIGLLRHRSDQAMKIGAGYVQAAGRQGLISIAFLNRLIGKPDFVVPELILERTRDQTFRGLERIGLTQRFGEVLGADSVA